MANKKRKEIKNNANDLSPVMMVVRNFGIVTVVNDTSNIEKLLRKKYMGVWRWASSRVRMIMVRFPVMLSM